MEQQRLIATCERAGATFSEGRTWRYTLLRRWSFSGDPTRMVAYIGLNPSTADEKADDPTIRRCINFAKQHGFEGMYMLNLFGFRATNPDDMYAYPEPIGAGNDAAIREVAETAGMVVAAWGKPGHAIVEERAKAVYAAVASIRTMFCLGRTKDGHPRHPLYVSGRQQFEPYDGVVHVKPKRARKSQPAEQPTGQPVEPEGGVAMGSAADGDGFGQGD